MTEIQLYNFWQLVDHIPGYQHILTLLGVKEESLNQMSIWDNEMIEIEQHYNKKTEFEVREQIREFKKELKDDDSIIEKRLEYLEQRKEFLENYITKESKHSQEMRQRFYHPIESLEWLRMAIMDLWNLPKYEKELKKVLFEIRITKNKDLIREGQITEEMIARAKEYPFENLITVPKSGFISCPYHKEKTPSFSLNRKHNYFHCFSCGKTIDTIQFVIDKYQKNFVEAVRYLNEL